MKNVKVRKNIPTKKIVEAFVAERNLWLKDYPQSAGALGCMFGRILNGQKVKDRKNGIEINMPDWMIE